MKAFADNNMAETLNLLLEGLKTLWEKEKMLVPTISFFFFFFFLGGGGGGGSFKVGIVW